MATLAQAREHGGQGRIMTPIKQTKFHSDTQKGNCFAAAIASLLDVPLHAVPELEELESPKWQEALFNWAELLGYEVDCHHDEAPKGYSIAGGMSIRGVKHAVIAWTDDSATYLVHDPHPSNSFIGVATEYWTFRKLGDV